MEGSINEHQKDGETRTSMDCHNCHKDFIALLDHSIDGNHVIECAHCGHKHYRTILNGVVTETRWGTDHSSAVKCRRVWKHDSLAMKTTTASNFIRDQWLNFGR